MTQSKVSKNRKAFALIYAIMIMFLVSITIAAMAKSFLVDYQQSKKSAATAGAYQMAQSGLEAGIAKYQQSPVTADTDPLCVSGTTAIAITPDPTQTNIVGDYSAKICSDHILGIGHFKSVSEDSYVTLKAEINPDKSIGNIYQIGTP